MQNRLAERSARDVHEHVHTYASTFGLTPPPADTSDDTLDVSSISFLSDLARRSRLSLPAFVRLLRGQTDADTRPNKNLYELPTPSDAAYSDVYRRWNEVVRHGVRPVWLPTKPSIQARRPENHQTLQGCVANVRRHIRKGQRDGRYLIVEESMLDQWQELFLSPIGAVEKESPEGMDIRIINDYSYPRGSSVNDFTERDDFPDISYNPPRDIALRIHELRTRHPDARVLTTLGDVSGAFRHVPVNEDEVHMFAFAFEGFVVIGLACGFGWCGSPAFYSLAGTIINHLYTTSRPRLPSPLDNSAFIGNVWCDDHTCVEVDTGQRCYEANIALRRSMAIVLGPTAINKKKFTSWRTNGKALGLLWDTATGTVSIPDDKLSKARARLQTLLDRRQATKSDLNRLLRVFRHVAICFPAARSFYQWVHVMAVSMLSYGIRTLGEDALDDLRWFGAVIANRDRSNHIALEQFAKVTIPSVHVYMDASDVGLCALEPSRQEYIRVMFTPAERDAIRSGRYENSINVRELQSAVLAALLWGPSWRRDERSAPTYVCFHIDNTSAVSWSNKRLSRHPTAQLYNRLLSLAEFQYQLSFSSEHIAGELNTMADAGSRAWTDTHRLWPTWTNLSSSWQQIVVNTPFDDLSGVWDSCCVDTPWQALPTRSIKPAGRNGAVSPE